MESCKSWQRSPSVQSTLLQPAFKKKKKKKALSSIWLDVFILLSKIKPAGERLFDSLICSNVTHDDCLITEDGGALHSKSFLFTPVVSKNFCPHGAISRQNHKCSVGPWQHQQWENYWRKGIHSLLHGSIIYVWKYENHAQKPKMLALLIVLWKGMKWDFKYL